MVLFTPSLSLFYRNKNHFLGIWISPQKTITSIKKLKQVIFIITTSFYRLKRTSKLFGLCKTTVRCFFDFSFFSLVCVRQNKSLHHAQAPFKMHKISLEIIKTNINIVIKHPQNVPMECRASIELISARARVINNAGRADLWGMG